MYIIIQSRDSILPSFLNRQEIYHVISFNTQIKDFVKKKEKQSPFQKQWLTVSPSAQKHI